MFRLAAEAAARSANYCSSTRRSLGITRSTSSHGASTTHKSGYVLTHRSLVSLSSTASLARHVETNARRPGRTTSRGGRGGSAPPIDDGGNVGDDDEDYFGGFLPGSKSGPLIPEQLNAGGGGRSKGGPGLRFNGEEYKTPAERRREKAEGERLNKALANLGVASRRGADDLIFGGRVKVNGETVTSPATRVNLSSDVVTLDGKIVQGGINMVKEHAYFMVNKPRGFVCSARANEGSSGKLVLDLLEQWREEFRIEHGSGANPPRLFTVGRLDVATTGLLLVTTDGDWCQRVAHPSSEVVKQYVVTANAKPTRAQIQAIEKGTEVDGKHVTPHRVELVSADGGPKNRIIVEVVDGRNREVRVLCADAGVDVKNLKRTRVGGLRMPKELPLGKYVKLKPHQVAYVLDKGLSNNNGAF